MKLPIPRKRILFGTLAFTTLPFLATAQIGPNIIGYWPLDGDFEDDSPTGAHGTFVETPTDAENPLGPSFFGAQFGDGIDLISTEKQYVLIDGAPAPTFDLGVASGGTGEVSISAWCDATAFDTAWQTLAGKGQDNNWRIARFNSSVYLAYAGGNADISNEEVDIDGTGMHHVLAVTHPTKGTRFYVDGLLVENTAAAELGNQNGRQMMIGSNPDAATRTWAGAIDDVIIFNRALSSTEALSIYNEGAGVVGSTIMAEASTDGDSMPDWWEEINGLSGSTNDEAGDLDGDGLLNPDEYTEGTDPDNADTDGDGIDDGEELIEGADGYITDPDTPDTDADNLTDGEEETAGTDPTNPDTDSDGVNDFDDDAPLDPTNDSDNDGIGNIDEVNGAQNPFHAGHVPGETPGGVPGQPTDPNLADSDNDGIVDGEEVNFPSDTNGFLTDPNNDDTDGDTFSDGQEVALGSDPTNPGISPSSWYSGLTGYWQLDGDLTDFSPTGADGTFTTEDDIDTAGTIPAFADAKFGQGIDLIPDDREAANIAEQWSQRVVIDSVDENTFDSNAGDLTISAWYRVDTFDQGWQALVAKGENTSYRIARRSAEDTMGYAGGTTDIPGANVGPNINDGELHHVVAITENGVSTRLWIDGTLVGTGAAPTLTDKTNFLNIGGNPDTAGNNFRTWNGIIDDVAIWKRPLSESEIAQIWAGGDGNSIETLITSLDTDGDGLFDSAENNSGTFNGINDAGSDPTNPDTNGDGVPDGAEALAGSNPSATDNDSDADGLTNLEETSGSQNPWTEGVSGTPPGETTGALVPDSDADGLEDGEEVDTYGTDPNNADSDGDLFADIVEIDAGSDPLDPGSTPPVNLNEGLVAYWPLDGNATDFSETGAHGTFVGENEAFAPAKFGTGASLDFELGQHYVIDSVDALTFDFGVANGGTGSLSVSAWCTVDGFTTAWQALVAKGEGNDWRVARNNSNSTMAYAGGSGDITGTIDVTDGEIHHIVAITEDGVSTRLYIDGSLDGTNLTAPTVGTGDSATYMMIGNNPDSTGRSWNGIIDDLAIWNRPLDDTEIGLIWNGGDGSSIASLTGIDTGAPTDGPTVTGFGFNASTGAVELSMAGLDDTRNYQMRRSILLDGTDWVDVGGLFTGGTSNTFEDPTPPTGAGAEAYYQVFDVSPSPD